MTPKEISAQASKPGVAHNSSTTSIKKRLAESMALPAAGETSAKKPKVEETPVPKPMNALAKILAERKAAAALAAATGIPQVFPSVSK